MFGSDIVVDEIFHLLSFSGELMVYVLRPFLGGGCSKLMSANSLSSETVEEKKPQSKACKCGFPGE